MSRIPSTSLSPNRNSSAVPLQTSVYNNIIISTMQKIGAIEIPKPSKFKLLFKKPSIPNLHFTKTRHRRRRQSLTQNLSCDLSSAIMSEAFNSRYTIEATDVAHGSGGSISIVRRRCSHKVSTCYAMKTINALKDDDHQSSVVVDSSKRRNNTRSNQLQNERRILASLDHPNIIRVLESYYSTDSTKSGIIMQLCTGGDLSSRSLSELQAANVMTQICSAVAYCHERRIVHRDLKLENILYETPDEDSEVKLIDFGLAITASKMRHTAGTMYTTAPEVLAGSYDKRCDSWSLGVIAYCLLSRTRPFNDATREVLIENIGFATISMKGKEWEGISNAAKDFVKNLIVKDPACRWSPKQCLSSRWLSIHVEKEAVDLESLIQSLERYCSYGTLKKSVLIVLASFMEANTAHRKAFRLFDPSSSGVITFPNFENVLKDATSASEYYFKHLCLHRSKTEVNYSEFLALMVEPSKLCDAETLSQVFEYFDTSNRGYVDKYDLYGFFGREISQFDVDSILFAAASKNNNLKCSNNGSIKISKEDFYNVIQQDEFNHGDKMKNRRVRSIESISSSLLMTPSSFYLRHNSIGDISPTQHHRKISSSSISTLFRRSKSEYHTTSIRSNMKQTLMSN